MKSLWLVKAFLLIIVILGLIGFFPLGQSPVFSFSSLILIGLIMISFDIALNLNLSTLQPETLNSGTLKSHNLKQQDFTQDNQLNNIEEKQYDNVKTQERHGFLITKIGTVMVIFSFLVECLIQ